MLGKLVFVALLAACPAAATSIYVAPLPVEREGADTAMALTRAVETALLQKTSGLDVVTPRALDTKIELDLAKACNTGDDASCVVDFAQALGVDFVVRPQTSTLGATTILTVSLYDGKRAALLAQAQRSAPSSRPEELLEKVPELVDDIIKSGGLPMKYEYRSRPPNYFGLGLTAGGAVVVAACGILVAGAGAREVEYQSAQLSRDDAQSWEDWRLVAFGAPAIGIATGAALVGFGALSLLGE